MTMDDVTANDLAFQILNGAMVEWEEAVRMLTSAQIQEVQNRCDAMAERAARLSGYLDARGATGCGDSGHSEGVKRSNKKAHRVRKALGFTYPRKDISF